MIHWIDAAEPCTVEQADAAKALGFTAVGVYISVDVPGQDPANTWTPEQVGVARAAGLAIVPIVVPSPPLTADPVALAQGAWSTCEGAYGLSGISESGLYCGNHLEATGRVVGPIWIPQPGAQPSSVGTGSAVQYGIDNIDGWNVDVSVAAEDWKPVLYVDYEYNTTGGNAGLEWYNQFQSEIARLAAGHQPAPIPEPPAPTDEEEDLMAKLVVAENGSAEIGQGTQWVVSSAGRFQVVEPYNNVWSGWLKMTPEPQSAEFIASVPVIVAG